MRRFWISILFLAALAAAQSPLHLGLAYAPEPPAALRLQLRRVRGQVQDREQLPVEGAALGLFQETGSHEMLAIVVSGNKGKFDFGAKVPPGDYQLVAQYPGLCTANIPITLTPAARHDQIVFTMTVPSLGPCSSARVK